MFELVFVIFILSITVINCEQTLSNDDVEDSYVPIWNWTDGFEWNIFKELDGEKRNFVFSPICLKIVLALLYQGSNANTQNEYYNIFLRTDKDNVRLQFHEILDKLTNLNLDHQIHVGSRIFLFSDLRPEQKFVKIAEDVFQTDVEPIDFSEVESKDIVNNWVKKLTNGKVTQLTQLDNLYDMVTIIANIVYLKGTWKYQFPKNQTFLGEFNLIKDSDVVLLLNTITVPYMTIEESFYYYEFPQFKVKILRLPYKNGRGRFSMLIILPTSNESLQTVLDKLDNGDMRKIFAHFLFESEKKRVRLTLPKFKINSEEKLTEVMQKFGMYQTFELARSPIPTHVVLADNARIFDVIQNVGIEVDETGGESGNKPEEVDVVFEVNRSFFFLVQDILGNVLLLGKVENPIEDSIVYN